MGFEINIAILDNGRLVDDSFKEGKGEPGSSVGHGEGGAASPILSLDDLITTELDAVSQGLDLLLREPFSTRNLRQ